MTADEIRKKSPWKDPVATAAGNLPHIEYFQALMLQEIAAQLAELNEHLDWVTDCGYIRVETR